MARSHMVPRTQIQLPLNAAGLAENGSAQSPTVSQDSLPSPALAAPGHLEKRLSDQQVMERTRGRGSSSMGIKNCTSCGRNPSRPVAQPSATAPTAKMADSRSCGTWHTAGVRERILKTDGTCVPSLCKHSSAVRQLVTIYGGQDVQASSGALAQ
eukprot:7936440-Pyramimonas_sp.AAC.1